MKKDTKGWLVDAVILLLIATALYFLYLLVDEQLTEQKIINHSEIPEDVKKDI